MSQIPSTANQAVSWNQWNIENREKRLSEISLDQRAVVETWLSQTGRNDLDIIDVGCGAGWLCPTLLEHGRVTATDFSEGVVKRAQERWPDVEFIAGDLFSLPFEKEAFDVVTSLEVLSHVSDQRAFVAKLAGMLRPSGLLMLATQNRPVLQNMNKTVPPVQGQIRKWVDRGELVSLLEPHFDVVETRTLTPRTNRMPWRLINNRYVNPALRAVLGGYPKRLKERMGWGWTLMALAQRRA